MQPQASKALILTIQLLIKINICRMAVATTNRRLRWLNRFGLLARIRLSRRKLKLEEEGFRDKAKGGTSINQMIKNWKSTHTKLLTDDHIRRRQVLERGQSHNTKPKLLLLHLRVAHRWETISLDQRIFKKRDSSKCKDRDLNLNFRLKLKPRCKQDKSCIDSKKLKRTINLLSHTRLSTELMEWAWTKLNRRMEATNSNGKKNERLENLLQKEISLNLCRRRWRTIRLS